MTDMNEFNRLTEFVGETVGIYFEELIFGYPISSENNHQKPFVDFIKKYSDKYNDDASISKLIKDDKFSWDFIEDWYYGSLGVTSTFIPGTDEFIDFVDMIKDGLDGGLKPICSDQEIEQLTSDILFRHKIYKKLSQIQHETDFKDIDQEIDRFLKNYDINKIYNEPDKISEKKKHSLVAVFRYLTDMDDKALQNSFSKSYPVITKFFLNMYEPISELIARAYKINYAG